ncbi:MAG: type IV pilus biogenesis/stability protein PilW [Gammaproteobacteria bacterium]|nr:type IV pilus biogenesis/stability protein PilW [Gammaproteobacteria bacterium]
MMHVVGAVVLAAAVLVIGACASTGSGSDDDVEPNEETAPINVSLGAQYLSQGELNIANMKLQRALEQDPNLATAHWTYALLQMRLNRADLAEQHFIRALALDPKDSLAHNAYGTFLCDRGRLPEAQAEFDKALDDPLYEQPETALTNVGVCALKGSDEKQAEDAFRRALARNATFIPALYEMVRLTYDQQRYAQTRQFLDRYAQTAGHTAHTLLLAVRTETGLGNRDAARAYAARLQQDYPESRQAARVAKMQRHGI